MPVRDYLLGKQFTGRLTWLLKCREPQGQLTRWLEELGEYDMKVEHRPGRKHRNADALSRIPGSDFLCENYRLGNLPDDLPCGGCSYCQKAHENWSHFVDVVDDIIPLAAKAKQISEITVEGSEDPEYAVTHMDILPYEEDPIFYIHGVTVDNPTPSMEVVQDLTSSEFLIKEQEADEQLTCLRKWLVSAGRTG